MTHPRVQGPAPQKKAFYEASQLELLEDLDLQELKLAEAWVTTGAEIFTNTILWVPYSNYRIILNIGALIIRIGFL